MEELINSGWLVAFIEALALLKKWRDDKTRVVAILEDNPVNGGVFSPMVRLVNEAKVPVTILRVGFEPAIPWKRGDDRRFGVVNLAEKLEPRAMCRHRTSGVAVEEDSTVPEIFRLFVETATGEKFHFGWFKKSKLRAAPKPA